MADYHRHPAVASAAQNDALLFALEGMKALRQTLEELVFSDIPVQTALQGLEAHAIPDDGKVADISFRARMRGNKLPHDKKCWFQAVCAAEAACGDKGFWQKGIYALLRRYGWHELLYLDREVVTGNPQFLPTLTRNAAAAGSYLSPLKKEAVYPSFGTLWRFTLDIPAIYDETVLWGCPEIKQAQNLSRLFLFALPSDKEAQKTAA